MAERLEREDDEYWAAQPKDDKRDYVKPGQETSEVEVLREVLSEEDIYVALWSNRYNTCDVARDNWDGKELRWCLSTVTRHESTLD